MLSRHVRKIFFPSFTGLGLWSWLFGYFWLAASAGAQSTHPAYRPPDFDPAKPDQSGTLNNFHRMRKAEVLRTFDGIGRLQFSACPRERR